MADPFDDLNIHDTYSAAYMRAATHHHNPANPNPNPYPSPTQTPTHPNLLLLLSLTLTLTIHPTLASHLLYWALRLLRPTPDFTSFPPIPFPLRPPHTGICSPYWATLHALRWEAGRNVAAARLAFFSYVAFCVLLGGGGGGVGNILGEVIWSVLGPVGRVYLYLLGVATAVRWGMLGFAGAVAFLRFVGFVVVEVVKGVGGFWGHFFMRRWRVVFALGMGWVCVDFLKRKELGEMWEEMAATVLLWLAEGIYLFGDVVRDMANVMEWAGWEIIDLREVHEIRILRCLVVR